MADRVTFDFETGEIIFDMDCQKGIEVDPDLKNKRTAIMASAGYDVLDMRDFRKELNAFLRGIGLLTVVCDGSDKEDIAIANAFDKMMQNNDSEDEN